MGALRGSARRLLAALAATAAPAWVSLPAAASAPASRTGPAPAPAPADPAILGGQAALACQWPTTVALYGTEGLCSGTLIAPRVVLYAAHCGTDFDHVTFGETVAGGLDVLIDRCERHTPEDQVAPDDYAFCVLADEVAGVPQTPVLFGCEASELTAGRDVVIAGFGEDDVGEVGTKHWASTTIAGFGPSGMIFVGGDGTGAWYGDSGGPAYLQLDDGSWRAFGIVSGGPGPGDAILYVDMETAVPWVEEESGIDITPCHHADGTWYATRACGGFATDPTATDSWDHLCGDDPLSGPSTTCGATFEPDDNPPTVEIVSPDDGAVFDPIPPSVNIEVRAADDDQVASVRLFIDGEQVDQKLQEPWTFAGVFGEGTYTLRAEAEDRSGNLTESAENEIDVGEGSGCGACGAAPGGGGGSPVGELLLVVLALAPWLRRRSRAMA